MDDAGAGRNAVERILFVDDDPIVRRNFARAMRHRGFMVDVAENGEEALSLAKDYSYAVVATDLTMPGLDGLSLIDRMRAVHPDSSYVLVTGARKWQRDAPLPGRVIEAVIQKPWDGEELAEALRRGVDLFRGRRLPSIGPAGAAPRRVLFVASDAHEARLIGRMMTARGGDLRVTEVRSVEEALGALHGHEYDALVVDVTGALGETQASIHALQSAAPRAAVVVLSDSNDDEFALGVVQAGAQDHLAKDQLDAPTIHRALRFAVERKRTERRLAYLAHHDQLTGLANRTLLRERLAQALARSRRTKSLVGLFYLDLDRFKSVNDSLGHDVGDALLKEVARRLTGCVRESDSVARIGGDEFAVVVDELAREEEATVVARRILNSFATPFRVGDCDMTFSTSIGISLSPDNALDVETLIKSADSAMYRAKERGRNCYQFFSDEVQARIARRLQLENDLRLAVESGAFELHYQPRYDFADASVVSREALLRWRRPDGTLATPSEFLDVLEETGLILGVSRMVLATACSEVLRWRHGGAPSARISVNVSAKQFDDPGFAESVEGVLAVTGTPADALELEFAERTLTRDLERSRESLDRLRERGVRIVVDDFGSSTSSLSFLKQCPIDALKVDQRLVGGITDAPGDLAIIRAIVGIGRALGFDVVAEGVESIEAFELMRSLGCSAAQGYYVGFPAREVQPADSQAAIPHFLNSVETSRWN